MNKAITAAAVLFLLPLFLAAPPLAHGQIKPRIYIAPLAADGFEGEEINKIETLLVSYFADMGTITSLENAEYSLFSRIRLDNHSRFLDIRIVDVQSGEDYFAITYPFRDFGELVLKAHTLTSLLRAAEPKVPPEPGSAREERLGPEQIRGTWRSGGDIQMIRLEYNGTGMLLFSSGVTMRLRYTIEDNVLKVVQDSPNNERYYHHLPQKAARELSGKAEPMRWELRLFEQGTVLRGTVIFTQALYEGDTLAALYFGATGQAEWQKSR